MIENYDRHARNLFGSGHCHIHKGDYCEQRDGDGLKTCSVLNGECPISLGRLVNFYDLEEKDKNRL
jgi:hypothetical protein